MTAHLRDLVGKDVERQRDALIELSHAIHADPETAFAEHHASARVARYLDGAGFEVQAGICDLPTAFAARSGTGELQVALFAEYDALPELGHACGHNIISAVSAGAASALAALVDELDITLTVFGTPAEEHGAGKVLMLERGAFDGIHAGLMVHPGPFDAPMPQTSAMGRYDIVATGRAAHAGATPFLGINAADAMVVAQTAIGLLRQHLPPGDQVHGVVTSAGTAPNVVPERAVADYVLRAPDHTRLTALERRVRACFAAGALATGARVQMNPAQPVLHELHSDAGLLELWTVNHARRGHRASPSVPIPISTDLGSLSLRVPCIHPIVGIGSWPAVNHQPGFAAAAIGPAADDALIDAATALAWTVVDLATDADRRQNLIDTTSDNRNGVPR